MCVWSFIREIPQFHGLSVRDWGEPREGKNWTVKEVQRLTRQIIALNKFISKATDKCLPFYKTLKQAFQWTNKCEAAFQSLKEYLAKPPLLSWFVEGEDLFLYLAVSKSVVNLALIREEFRVQ